MDLAGSRNISCPQGRSRHVALPAQHCPIPCRAQPSPVTTTAMAGPIPCQHQQASATSTALQRPRRRVQRLAAVASSSMQMLSKGAQPDLVLEAAALKHKVLVFGVEHTSSAPAIAEFILRSRPAAVVVETSVTPEHGARPGNAITCKDRLIEGPAAFYMRMFCSVATNVAKQAADHGGDMVETSLWKQAAGGAYRGEQLVYVAALACGSPLLFGDRPKDITYRRLYTMASAAQLDEGYGHQAAINYLEMLGKPRPAAPLDGASMVERISMQEREAVMCSVAHNAASGVLAATCCTPPAEAAADQAGPDASTCTGDVVMVVGAAHLPGIEQLWEGGRWQELLGSQQAIDSGLLAAPDLATVPDREVGLKRGLLTALLRMSATREVLEDVEQTLGPVPPQHLGAYQAVGEVYGSTRTMLSCLDRELLDQVCHGLRDDQGKQLDLYETLAYVRANRPSQGGPGFSEEMVTFIRGLNFDLD